MENSARKRIRGRRPAGTVAGDDVSVVFLPLTARKDELQFVYGTFHSRYLKTIYA